MNRDKWFFRHVLFHYFDLKKTTAKAHWLISETYSEQAPLERTCRDWFKRFRSGDLCGRQRTFGTAKKIWDAELQALLDENPTQTLEELSKVLNVTLMAIFEGLHTSNRHKVILLRDNAQPYVTRTVKETLLKLEWEVLPHSAYSLDLALSNYHLFRSKQHALADTYFSITNKSENGWMNGLLQ